MDNDKIEKIVDGIMKGKRYKRKFRLTMEYAKDMGHSPAYFHVMRLDTPKKYEIIEVIGYPAFVQFQERLVADLGTYVRSITDRRMFRKCFSMALTEHYASYRSALRTLNASLFVADRKLLNWELFIKYINIKKALEQKCSNYIHWI